MTEDWITLSDPDMTRDEIAAVAEVLQSPQITSGPSVTAFESAFAGYLGRKHAVAVASGTIGHGDRAQGDEYRSGR